MMTEEVNGNINTNLQPIEVQKLTSYSVLKAFRVWDKALRKITRYPTPLSTWDILQHIHVTGHRTDEPETISVILEYLHYSGLIMAYTSKQVIEVAVQQIHKGQRDADLHKWDCDIPVYYACKEVQMCDIPHIPIPALRWTITQKGRNILEMMDADSNELGLRIIQSIDEHNTIGRFPTTTEVGDAITAVDSQTVESKLYKLLRHEFLNLQLPAQVSIPGIPETWTIPMVSWDYNMATNMLDMDKVMPNGRWKVSCKGLDVLDLFESAEDMLNQTEGDYCD